MADFRLGRLKFKWQGDWTASTAYVIDDIIKYGGNTYVCIKNHTSSNSIPDFYVDLGTNNWDLHTEGNVDKGAWTASTYYRINDVVKYGNVVYRCTTQHSSGASFTPSNFSVYLEGLNFEDTWNGATEYQKGDIVTYRGYSYISKGTHTTATTPNADTTNWEVLTTGFSAQGAYNAATTYAPGDVVRFGGNTFVNILGSTGTAPTVTSNWTLLSEGLSWTGNWDAGTVYQKGDVVNRNSNSYVCKANDVSGAATAPELDPGGAYWNYVAQGGNTAQVLQDTGDMLYQAASGVNRIALPTGSTGTAAQQAEASGQVMTVGGSPLLPRWEKNNVTDSVYYVTKDGSDANSGRNISRGFASLRHACDTIGALTGNAAPSNTNPLTIFVKAGTYEETLPIVVPENVSIIGDNLRTSVLKPSAGNSNMQALTLSSNVTHLKFGETVSNDTGTKTAMVLDSDYANNIHLLNITGGEWTTGDKYVDLVDNKHSDGSTLLTNNKDFLAHQAYHAHTVTEGVVQGTEGLIKQRLAELVGDLAYNIKHGANNKVHEWATDLTGGNTLTGSPTQDDTLIDYILSAGLDVISNVSVTPASGNSVSQWLDSNVTASTDVPKCTTVRASYTTLCNFVIASIGAGNTSGTSSTNPYISIATAGTRTNAESTFCLLGSHTTLNDLVFEGMSGFVPSGSDDKDMDTSTVKGVFFRFNPNSSIQKSPYIQNCTVFGGAAIGVLLDGAVHNHFNLSSNPSYKTMVFDSYTQVLDGGVGFYVTNAAATEIVSSFTYYAHISYTCTRGGRIRGVTGNSSYGKYGAIARGYDTTETTIDGSVKGLRLELDKNTNYPLSGNLQIGENLVGATSGAVGELRNDQSGSAYLYYYPVKGTFTQGEDIVSSTSNVTATLVNNTDAVTGQKGYTLVVEGLTSGPDSGGSVELVDNGSNDDTGSYVITTSSYTAPDGRGNLTVAARGGLGTTAAAHSGTDQLDLFQENTNASSTTLAAAIAAGDGPQFVVSVGSTTGMVATGFIVIDDEMFKIDSFGGPTSLTVTRAQEGTVAAGHSNGSAVTIFDPPSRNQDILIEDINDAVTVVRVQAANAAFGVNDWIKVGSEFMKLNAVTPDTTGITSLSFADEKVIAAGNGQDFKIRYRYSQVRLTAHDFLDVGTGSKSNTNWPGLPLSPNVPSHETHEERPGRVYYVSTDQDGNFSVGKYFRVEQATGKATLDASAFDLQGLSTLRLGAIGAQLGATINEFSTDGTLSQNDDNKCPTQKAVKTYVDNLSSVQQNFTVGGNLTVKGTTTSVNSVTLTSKDRNIELGVVANAAFTADGTAGSNTILNVSDTTNIAPGVVITITSGGGTVTAAADTKVTAISGTTVTLDSVLTGSGSATGITFNAAGTSDTTADTGGLTLADGTADGKFIKWLASNDSWNFNKSLELASGLSITVNGTSVLTGTTVHGKTFVTDFSTVDHSVIPTVGAINEAVAKKVTAASYYSGSF